MDTKSLICNLTRALSFQYPNDRMMPGVTISHLRNSNFYVSLVRYNPTKSVVFKVQYSDLNRGLEEAAKWLVSQKEKSKNPMDELNDLLSPTPAWPCPDPHAYDEVLDEEEELYDPFDSVFNQEF